ncbi:MAG: STAS domain-containing protein [Methanospirillaceae archaeon]|nr:STAS domain-containing protein [Methanospirillaceae archaeon]
MKNDTFEGFDLQEEQTLSILPVFNWISAYRLSWLWHDIPAGLLIALGSIPICMAYATLAGLPAQYGLYAGIIAPFLYFLFGTSRQVILGPCLIQSFLVITVIGAMAAGDLTRYLALASATAVITGILSLIAWRWNLGFLQNILSLPILKGFILGAGILIIIFEIPLLLGMETVSPDLVGMVTGIMKQAALVNAYSVGIGFFTLILLVVVKKLHRSIPMTFILMAVAILLSGGMHMADQGVPVIGSIPAGLFPVTLPLVSFSDLMQIIPLAFVLFFISYVELATVTRCLANKKKYEVDTTQELLALGTGNIISGLFSGFPVSADTERSEDNFMAGAATQVAGLVASIILFITILFFVPLLYHLPVSFLAAIIIASVIWSVDISGLMEIGFINRSERILAVITGAGVIICGIIPGMIIGIILTLLSVLYQISYPPVPMLGRFPGTTLYGDIEREPEKEPTPKVLIVKIDLPFIFANTEVIYSRIIKLLREQEEPVQLLIIDLESSPVIDHTGVLVLLDLFRELHEQGISLRLAHTSEDFRNTLKRAGIEGQMGTLKSDVDVQMIIEDWRRHVNKTYTRDFYHTAPGNPPLPKKRK